MRDDYSIIVFSHLRWDFVYQRPQHILTRMGTQHRVLFIEEPVFEEGTEPHLISSNPEPNVFVYKPCLPVPGAAFSDSQKPLLVSMVNDLLEREEIVDYVAWLYTPVAIRVAKAMQPEPAAVVFDCMDELSKFQDAPAELLDREAELLRWADVVFTGGRSLYRAKKDKHSNIHCFPSSVDAEHFGRTREVAPPADQADIPGPRLGFYGVIDERMDLQLLDAVATTHPDWHLVIVGPVVKINPDTLPRRPNIHYMGQRTYAELPSYLAGWDVCLMPFALNDSTKFISPTKVLEYMAAGLPIVSTPITDVVEPYGNIVYVGKTAEEFILACELALSAPNEERDARSAAMLDVLSSTSWDATVEQMYALITEAVARKQARQRFYSSASGRGASRSDMRQENRSQTSDSLDRMTPSYAESAAPTVQ